MYAIPFIHLRAVSKDVRFSPVLILRKNLPGAVPHPGRSSLRIEFPSESSSEIIVHDIFFGDTEAVEHLGHRRRHHRISLVYD